MRCLYESGDSGLKVSINLVRFQMQEWYQQYKSSRLPASGIIKLRDNIVLCSNLF